MRTLTILMCFLLFVADASAQSGKKRKPKAEPMPDASYEVIAEPVRIRTMIDTAESYKRALRQLEAIRLPEPLIAAHYLIEYPKEAQEQKIEGAVKFTVRVKEGKVINSQIDRSDNVLLNNAVLDVANRLQFDLSWHTPDKQEIFYTKEVVFELPDTIFARP